MSLKNKPSITKDYIKALNNLFKHFYFFMKYLVYLVFNYLVFNIPDKIYYVLAYLLYVKH